MATLSLRCELSSLAESLFVAVNESERKLSELFKQCEQMMERNGEQRNKFHQQQQQETLSESEDEDEQGDEETTDIENDNQQSSQPQLTTISSSKYS